MSNKNNPTQSTTETKTKKERKPKKPSKLRDEIKRVAEATGLPTAYITKQVKAEREAIDKARRDALDTLASRVAKIVTDAIKNVKVATE